jgi:hypothetical protein
MNLNTKLRGQAAVLVVALGGALALTGGCSTMSGESTELQPTVYVAVAPLDLPEDYDAYPMNYVPVAPLDLEDENTTQVADSEVDEVALVSTDDWMAP